ncbi:unnamed protein product [Staurois parvus]|uniref:Uncharacterized protein n=1 Tax=Staurois parvus TaxID=386267 RepID=A0ABN9B4P4_9NEOB|nr:unnamed protein product [Staurois parvus]
MGPCTASSCCCQVQSVSWVPVRPPIAAARPVICHGPHTNSSCCCQARNLSWGPCTQPPRLLMLLPGPECVSSHCWWFPYMVTYGMLFVPLHSTALICISY